MEFESYKTKLLHTLCLAICPLILAGSFPIWYSDVRSLSASVNQPTRSPFMSLNYNKNRHVTHLLPKFKLISFALKWQFSVFLCKTDCFWFLFFETLNCKRLFVLDVSTNVEWKQHKTIGWLYKLFKLAADFPCMNLSGPTDFIHWWMSTNHMTLSFGDVTDKQSTKCSTNIKSWRQLFNVMAKLVS